MGEYNTLPKQMEWRSTELEAAIAGRRAPGGASRCEMGTFAKRALLR
jgi:hypothetical protein